MTDSTAGDAGRLVAELRISTLDGRRLALQLDVLEGEVLLQVGADCHRVAAAEFLALVREINRFAARLEEAL
jgi:hypothetical protein